ncbi:hypothetical protein [Spirosoma validum]|uniref:Uncharacterized protein n=1 Tax=Spirosoma validum TaxID=2771355 RepID=A0A927GGP7_9BACT|nr:hypothetical protein [Spirosoma validum]MBD2756835.1 hypothetical protein [Spirosoma validum]
MTLTKRLRLFFSRNATSALSVTPSDAFMPVTIPAKIVSKTADNELISPIALPALSNSEPLPDWLLDDEALRDEGVLFGLSDASSDGKLAQIRAAFAQQTAPLDEAIEQYSERIVEFNLSIEQRDNQILSLRNQLIDLRNSQIAPTYLIRTVVSLGLSVIMGIGNFYLVDVTLHPSFPNRWIAVGVFLAGMFNLFGRTSFFYETDSKLSGRRIVEEVGMPLAASVFILVQSLQTQPVGMAIGLFVFVFFLFLLSGKLLLSTLTALQTDLAIIQKNRQLTINKEQQLPVWENEIQRLEREVDAIRTQKWPIATSLNHAEAKRNQLNAQRDRLVNLFLSEFELARSLRKRLSEQQLKSMMNYE